MTPSIFETNNWPINYRLDLAGSFWTRVLQLSNGCWGWSGTKNKKGYGSFKIGNRCYRVHRMMWESMNGAIPAGMEICHACDNPSCVRPDHLFIGTKSDNMKDSARKGRNIMQKAPWRLYRLTQHQADEARRLYRLGTSMRSIGRSLEVSESTIRRIIKGETYVVIA